MNVNFKLTRVKLSDLKVAVAYQRVIRKSHVKRIIDTFEPDAVQAIKVGKRDNGSMYVVDGQHLCAALTEMGYTHWPVAMFESSGRAHEAKVFRIHNSASTRKAVNKIEMWYALLVEGDSQAREVNKIVKGFGYKISNNQEFPYIKCVGIVQNLYEQDVLTLCLSLLTDAWGELEDKDMLCAYVLGGLGGYIDHLNKAGKWDDKVCKKLLAKMKATSPKRMKVAIADRCQGSNYNRAKAGVVEFSILMRKHTRAKKA